MKNRHHINHRTVRPFFIARRLRSFLPLFVKNSHRIAPTTHASILLQALSAADSVFHTRYQVPCTFFAQTGKLNSPTHLGLAVQHQVLPMLVLLYQVSCVFILIVLIVGDETRPQYLQRSRVCGETRGENTDRCTEPRRTNIGEL